MISPEQIFPPTKITYGFDIVSSGGREVVIGDGEEREVTLADGTKVTLRSNGGKDTGYYIVSPLGVLPVEGPREYLPAEKRELKLIQRGRVKAI